MDNKLHGIHIRFIKNKKVICIKNYIKGKPYDLFIEWHYNGNIKRLFYLKNDKIIDNTCYTGYYKCHTIIVPSTQLLNTIWGGMEWYEVV